MKYFPTRSNDDPKPFILVYTFLASALMLLATAIAGAADPALKAPEPVVDWPTYQHDNQRSGVTAESLTLPLHEQWRYTSAHKPAPAWPAPAKRDTWNRVDNIQPRVTFDRVYHVTTVGESVFFASSVDDKIYCLDAASGTVRWTFFTSGPVRTAPSIARGRVYAGSDDGWVYCLDAASGSLIWKHEALASDRMIIGNGRMISPYPIRAGVLVDRGVVYVCAGLFPTQGVVMEALDAETGEVFWSRDSGASTQGYLLASETRLYAPTGRTAPRVFDRRNGNPLNSIGGEGGAFALLSGDTLIYGTSRPGGQLGQFDAAKKDSLISFSGKHIIVTPTMSYLHTEVEIRALDRTHYLALMKERKSLTARRRELEKQIKADGEGAESERLKQELQALLIQIGEVAEGIIQCVPWSTVCSNPNSFILAGDKLFAGGDGEVAAYSTRDGRKIWTGKVEGKADGLAVARGRLYVSTDRGTIHCFGMNAIETRLVQHAIDPLPYPEDGLTEWYAKSAQSILDEAKINKGFGLVLGVGDGRLALELARRSELKIIGIDDDKAKIEVARRALDKTGLYGKQVVFFHGSLESLPFMNYFANLIVSNDLAGAGGPATEPDEVYRVLRPSGGVALIGSLAPSSVGSESLGNAKLRNWIEKATSSEWQMAGNWAVTRRGRLEGSGEWTHQYADAANTACSSDELAHGSMGLQWFGAPGPHAMIERHDRTVAPLYKDGRIFIPADNQIIVADAYNGTPLWQKNIPNSRRVGIPMGSGSMALSDDLFYIAVEGTCWGMDVETGRLMKTFVIPGEKDDSERRWGYIATVGDSLLGSSEKPGSARTEIDFKAIDEQYTDYRPLSTSDSIFSLDRHTGQTIWRHRSGAITNSSITVGGGRVYFYNSKNPEAMTDEDGRVTMAVMRERDDKITALDLRTGEVAWEISPDMSKFDHVMFLSYANETLLAVGSNDNKDERTNWYHVKAYDARGGLLLWEGDHANSRGGLGGQHGEQVHHPAIIGNTLIAEPRAYNIKTGALVNLLGEPGEWNLRKYGGCGTISASMGTIFYRESSPTMYQLGEGGGPMKLTTINRPGCWINIIPAGGMVLIPEASSGCTCSYAIQTSMAFMPR